jgi:RNA polymerase sigma-70 factor (ECF subfamily)
VATTVIGSVDEKVDTAERFDALFKQHHADVYRYCVRRLGRPDAEDAAAEVFAVAWRRLDAVPEDASRAWLLGVAYKTVGNQYRSRARRSRLVARLAAAPNAAQADGDPGDQRSDAVLRALGALSRTDRELLMMVAWDQLSRREASQILGIKENALDQRLLRARSRLRSHLERDPDLASEPEEKPS